MLLQVQLLLLTLMNWLPLALWRQLWRRLRGQLRRSAAGTGRWEASLALLKWLLLWWRAAAETDRREARMAGPNLTRDADHLVQELAPLLLRVWQVAVGDRVGGRVDEVLSDVLHRDVVLGGGQEGAIDLRPLSVM